MASVLAAHAFPLHEITAVPQPPAGLYVHIPFCDAKCHYCDFVTFTDRSSQIEPYLKALTAELERYRGLPIRTLFIGGGTPTVLSVGQIDSLMGAIHRLLDTRALVEATVEANPESATPEKLAAYRAGGINRVSFGLQTTNNALLKSLGRLHDREKFFAAFDGARSLGFDNINVDLMYGLPDQSAADWSATLDDVLRLSPEHISGYALKVEPGTKLAKEGFEVDGDLEADMYLAASETLTSNGYEHYEISNFAKPGREAKHNLLYWENKSTVGVGVSSASYVDGRRFKNTTQLQVYMDGALAGDPVEMESTTLSVEERERESVMLALRLKGGVASDALARMKAPAAAAFLARGLAVEKKGMYSLTPKGWLLSNLLFQQFV